MLSVSVQLHTLDPAKFTRNEVVDLSGVTATPWVKLSNGGTMNVNYKAFGAGGTSNYIQVPFPPGTKGIFYFHDRTIEHPVAGDIRFRVLPVNHAQDWSSVDATELFARGHDLLDCHGFAPWRIPLLAIIYKQRRGLYPFMKELGHISEAAETQVNCFRIALATQNRVATCVHSQIVERITHPFIMDLAMSAETFIFLTAEGITRRVIPTRRITVKQRQGVCYPAPAYSGARFCSVVLLSLALHLQSTQAKCSSALN